MTRTISLIIGIAVVALVAVPAAFGEGRLAGSQEQDGVAYFYANERATLAAAAAVVSSRRTDACDRGQPSSGEPRYVRVERYGPSEARREHVPRARGRARFDLRDDPRLRPPIATSGREVEWPQIGIGFGIGIALAIVLGLTLRATRPRPLAH